MFLYRLYRSTITCTQIAAARIGVGVGVLSIFTVTKLDRAGERRFWAGKRFQAHAIPENADFKGVGGQNLTAGRDIDTSGPVEAL